MTEEWVCRFHLWLERMTAQLPPSDIVAVNVNLYESPPAAEMVGSTHYDEVDADWACEEAFLASERHEFPPEVFERGWKDALASIVLAMHSYLGGERQGAVRLRSCRAVTVGFVDGSLVRVWPR